jgi:hypothetical protein
MRASQPTWGWDDNNDLTFYYRELVATDVRSVAGPDPSLRRPWQGEKGGCKRDLCVTAGEGKHRIFALKVKLCSLDRIRVLSQNVVEIENILQ